MSDKLTVASKSALTQPESNMSRVDIGALMESAVKQGSAMEVFKELRAMEADIQARRSKAAFDEALSAFQSECPTIVKTKGVSTNSGALAYKYAPIEEIEIVIRPIERAHGFNHTFNQDVESQPGWVIARCIVTHVAGHTRETVGKFPIGTKTQIMSDTQVYASALTFCNRRVLANAYGLVIAGEDKDGAGKQKASVSGKVATPATLAWFIEQTKPIHKQLMAYAIDKAIIMPDQTLDDWPLEQCPTSKTELTKLKAEVEAHQ